MHCCFILNILQWVPAGGASKSATRQKFIVFTNVKTLRSEMQITGVCVCVCVCAAEQIYKP